MPWYKAGTVSVALNNGTVTGTNTSFGANSRVGDAFLGPDGRWYEVTNIASNTVLSISPNYLGPTIAAGNYALAPMQGYVKDSADQLRQIVNQWGATLAGLGTVATENIVPVTKGGTGGSNQAAAREGLGLGNTATATLTSSDKDTTLGRVLKVGDFGLGAAQGGPVIGPNLAYNPGFSRFSGDEAGSPIAGTGGTLITNTVGGSYIQQIAQTPRNGINNPYVAVRHFSATGSPGPWCLFYHSGNTTRAADGTLKAI